MHESRFRWCTGGEHIRTVQSTFGKLFNAGTEFARDGSQFDHLFSDGERYQVGNIDAVAIHTPGHDRGHLCFRESRYGAMLAGDMLSTISSIVIDPPEGHLATYLASLERLAQGPMTTLYPAHGPAMRDGQRLVAQYLRHRRQREASLVAALEQGGGTVEQLLPKVYWDVDARLHPIAARSLLAGLLKLQEEGRAAERSGLWRPVASG